MTLLIILGAVAVIPLAWWLSQLGAGSPARPPAPEVPKSEAGVRALLNSGDTIGAIKLYRELSGLGLKEAKDAVDALAQGQPLAPVTAGAPGRPAVDADADPEIRRLVREGQLIAAIKRYRELTGAGLKDAKDAIERMLP